MHTRSIKTLAFAATLLGSFYLSAAQAGEQANQSGFEPKYKVVIQVSSADPVVHKIALNNAVNLQKALGIDNVAIEIVAYGPGLSIMTPKSPQSSRIPSLAMQNIGFRACGNTMRKIAKKTGKDPTLVEGVTVVPSGVEHIVLRQSQGWSYVRP